MSLVQKQNLKNIEAAINNLIVTADSIAEENGLEFTVNFPSGQVVHTDWTQSWSSSTD